MNKFEHKKMSKLNLRFNGDKSGKMSKVNENQFNILKIWFENINLDLLKSCIGYQRKKRLLNRDGSLIDIDRLHEHICNRKQSRKTRQLTWPYLLNIYSPSMTSKEKKIFENRAKIRYEK